MKSKNKGVTLIEVMVVVAIVGMLAAIAIPAYNDYITRSRRAAAFTALETVRAAQEMYRAEKGLYASNFVDGATTVLAGCSTIMGGENYTIWPPNRINNTTYSVRAEPQNKQTGDYYLGIDSNGNHYRCKGSCPDFNPSSPGSWQRQNWEDLR